MNMTKSNQPRCSKSTRSREEGTYEELKAEEEEMNTKSIKAIRCWGTEFQILVFRQTSSNSSCIHFDETLIPQGMEISSPSEACGLSCYFSHLKWEQMAAGLTSGAVTTAILHPLELAKIRLQVNEGYGAVKIRPVSSHFVGTLREIYRVKGFPGLYQGAAPNLMGNAVSWGLYFLFYGALKNYAQDGDESKMLGSGEYLALAGVSGAVVLWLTNPIWVAKTRMCLQYETLGASYRLTTWSTLMEVWRTEGIRGFYRGVVPGMIGVSSGAVQFLLYEELRNFYNCRCRQRTIDTHLKASEYLLIGIISKAMVLSLTYPHQVVRTRLQEQHRNYSSLANLLKTIWSYEGARGFYKGLLANILRTAPSGGLMFVIYENCYKWLTALR
ncbi:Mitochondrial folate transporter/carrier [Echinococcus granulosus]|uniref:Mitochondrial folate transporter/carrier n=2 Tax=Echinococcus granulosus TaxID=6210 RepID=W6UQT8_ECHGR|nr:Mitochondrial folate transporter/carrier [Echinococcus granulosus]EUB63066.1 Mitochondrial folate transporter/carrier [Echinococcus granulosus]